MADVTVFGAGIFGLSAAWSCIQRGARVQVIDPNGVAAGSSGGIVGALAPHTPENWNSKKQFQFESLIMAEAYWKEIRSVGGEDPGYARLGRVQPIMDERSLGLAKERSEHAKQLWQGHASWAVISEKDRPEWAPTSPTGALIYDTLSARIHPRSACNALAAAILSRGGKIEKDGVPTGTQIWATGWEGLMSLSEETGRQVGNGVKGQGLLLDLDRRNEPQLFADTVHIVPHFNGTTAIGSTSEREFQSPTETDAQLDALLARAIAAVPYLEGAQILTRWAGVRPRAKSRAPMLGAHPTMRGAFIANGGFKIGFGMAPKIGEVMADLVLDGRDTIPDDFRVEASL